MSLIKNIKIAFLCTTVTLSLCHGMEQPHRVEEEEKGKALSITSVEDLYQKTLKDLKDVLSITGGLDTTPQLLKASKILRQLAQRHDHPQASELYILLYENYLGVTTSKQEKLQARIKMLFMVGLPGQASTRLFEEIIRYDKDIHSFLREVLCNKEFITKFFNELEEQISGGLLYGEQSILVQLTVLDNFFMSNLYKNWSLQLDAKTQATIAKLYINALSSGWVKSNETISVMYGPQNVSIPNRASSYLVSGLRQCILAAKQGNDDGYNLLRQTLVSQNAYELYYKQLLPLLQSGDDQAQDLFNLVASEDKQAFVYFDQYANRELQRDKRSPLISVFDRIMENFDHYIKTKDHSFQKTILINHTDDMLFFEPETPIISSTPPSKSEAQLTPKDKYKIAMSCYGTDSAKTLNLFDEIKNDKSSSKALIKTVNGQLADIKKKKGYTDPSSVKEIDRAGNIGYQLRIGENSKKATSTQGKQQSKNTTVSKKPITNSNSNVSKKKTEQELNL